MTDIPDYQRIILERYLARRQAWVKEGTRVPDEESRTPSPMGSIGNMSIDELVRSGKPFYNEDKQGDKFIGVAHSLREVQEYIKNGGIIASLPLLIAGKTKATKKEGRKDVRNTDHYLWKTWLTALSEENVGIDTEGKYVDRGKPIVITVHGGGILSTPERILKAYADGLTPQNAASYVDKRGRPTGEFENLLKGRLPNGEPIQFYSIDDVLKGKIQDPFARFAIWNDFNTAKMTSSGYHAKADFLKNELVLSRTATTSYLSAYFDLAENGGRVGNWHRLTEIDPEIPQGRVLFVYDNYYGLNDDDDDLGSSGRFVGVSAGGARRTP